MSGSTLLPRPSMGQGVDIQPGWLMLRRDFPGNLPLECSLSSGKSALFLLDPTSVRLSGCRAVGLYIVGLGKTQGGGWLGEASSSPSLELLSPSTALARPLSAN